MSAAPTRRSALDAETRAALRTEHVAWARERLSGEWGRRLVRRSLEAGFRAVLEAPVERVVDLDAVVALVDHVASGAVVDRTIRPLVRTAALLEIARMREEPSKLASYVPADAVAIVDRLLERPGLLPERFVREVITHRAFEEVMRDVLDDALREFSIKVDPFKAEWGLPSLMKKAGPLAMFAKGLDVVAREFESRLEPERRKFLQGFARRALGLTADFTLKRADDPPFVAARKELFRWLLDQPLSELMAQATEPVVEHVEAAAHAIARHVAELDATKRQRRAQIELHVRAHAKETVAQALERYGAAIEPDFDALAAAAQPAFAHALQSPEIDGLLDELVGGFYDDVAEGC